MAAQWLQQTILRLAAWLAPAGQRLAWLEAWRSELWYVAPRQATRFCLGAFSDAWWLRRNFTTIAPRPDPMASPLGCLAVLSALAVASIGIAGALPFRGNTTAYANIWASHVPEGCLAMLFLSALLLPAIGIGLGPAPYNRAGAPWQAKVRRAVFLGLKIALVQPVMLCGFITLIAVGPLLPFLPQLAMLGFWILTLRWTLTDQRNRCPVCLRLLNHPVRIGAASGTFLEWYGAESACTRGHGLLQVPGISASYAGTQQWLHLDASWKPLFEETTTRR